jgi:hypothetical protein
MRALMRSEHFWTVVVAVVVPFGWVYPLLRLGYRMIDTGNPDLAPVRHGGPPTWPPTPPRS